VRGSAMRFSLCSSNAPGRKESDPCGVEVERTRAAAAGAVVVI